MEVALFDGVPLLTAPGRVMTPRPTSEELVGRAAAHAPGGGRAVDVGTGTGALAVALALRRPDIDVWATDTSRFACLVARANVALHRLESRVFVERGDLLSPLHGRFDVVLANLPYLPESVADARPELAGEPPEAIYAPGDGLEPYRRLLREARDRLTPDGVLVLQLHRRVLTASRADLAALARALTPPRGGFAAHGRAVAQRAHAPVLPGARASLSSPATP